MSIIIGGQDITRYVNKGGINEGAQKVYPSGKSSSNSETCKGAHYVYTISAQLPLSVKNSIAAWTGADAVSCSINGTRFDAEMTNFSASVLFEYGDVSLWNVSFTVSDIALSDET